jgi:hypothetical protein
MGIDSVRNFASLTRRHLSRSGSPLVFVNIGTLACSSNFPIRRRSEGRTPPHRTQLITGLGRYCVERASFSLVQRLVRRPALFGPNPIFDIFPVFAAALNINLIRSASDSISQYLTFHHWQHP